MTHYKIPEISIPGKPLGRHVNHDVRSFGFPFKTEPRKLTNTYWPRSTGILDQADVGACTGFAMCGCAACGIIFTGLPASHPALDNAMGFKLYSEATGLDSYPGSWDYRNPNGPNSQDTGSDGVSAMKAAMNDYLISGYTHTFDLNTALQAVMTTPVIIGLNWYSSFDNPAADGTVSISSRAYVRGGHEVLVRGLSADNSELLLDNSWGTGWGNNGSFKFSFSVFERLLSEDGDCTVPMPLNQPKPTPIPVIWTANGIQSFLGLSTKRGTPVSTILKNTVKQYKAYSANMSQYLQQGDLTRPIPAGENLCLAWPQYSIG